VQRSLVAARLEDRLEHCFQRAGQRRFVDHADVYCNAAAAKCCRALRWKRRVCRR
jgi:hypothetical protein